MKKSSLTVLMASALALSSGFAHAQSLSDLGDLPGGTLYATGLAVSPDGRVVVGRSNTANGPEAFRWTQSGGMVGLGELPGGTYSSNALAVNANGAVIVGGSVGANGSEAFRWTQTSGMVGLGDLAGGGFSSEARGVSADGSVVVGEATSANGSEAFRWTQTGGMVGLGDLAGGGFSSEAKGVSADGSVVIGQSISANGYEAFRWTQATGMVGLGDLPGRTFGSDARAISSDGNVIVGGSNGTNGSEAFRWTQGTGMVGLGDLAGGSFSSFGIGVNADGTVIVGQSAATGGNKAFRWTQTTGMEDVNVLLATAGVDMTGWNLNIANGVDATGNIIVGYAMRGSDNVAYIANLQTMAITTPDALMDSLSSALMPVQQSHSAMSSSIGQSLFAATKSVSAFRPNFDLSNPSAIAPAAGDVDRVWSGYMTGSFGTGQDNDFSNHAINGTMGLLVELDRTLVVGGGIIGSHSNADREFNGDSSLDSKGGALIAAYEADNGVRIYGTAFVADLEIDSKRGYLNGAGLDASYADIDGIGYGAALRGGYEFAVTDKTNLMPYVEIQASRTKLDGYTETGGGFPATFGDTKSDLVTSYVGTEISYDLTASVSVGGRAAWAHRLKQDDNGLATSVVGFTGTLDSDEGDKNWGEGAVNLNWQVSDDTNMGVELGGRSGKTQEPAASLTLGLISKF